jgi:hypothetical protein
MLTPFIIFWFVIVVLFLKFQLAKCRRDLLDARPLGHRDATSRTTDAQQFRRSHFGSGL